VPISLPLRAGKPWALIEIGCETEEAERMVLIRAAYRSSRAGIVALALRGVTAQSVDRVLDGVVDAREGAVKGVVYLNGNDERALFSAAADAAVVVASTERFRRALAAHGIVAVDSKESARVLGA
jgi:hypothetical protein